jgi:xylan 1,4-beta-xylosidase
MPIQLEVDIQAEGKPLNHFWSVCVGAGRAQEGLRATWLEHLKIVSEHCGFQYVRFHGLFHDDMFVYREKEGRAVYNFQYVDDLFDRLLDIGVRPFVEFGFSPKDMASGPETIFWWKGNVAPPKDYSKWAGLIRSCAIHWIDRYGLDEVRKWYFEVWNEPNLGGFFSGTRTQYFELYKATAIALKSVDSLLRVGGPATSNFVPDERFDGEKEDISHHAVVTKAEKLDLLEWRPVWLERFLAYCAREKLPVDFVSTHPYPTDWPLDEKGALQKFTRGVDATATDLKLLRKLMNHGPYAQAEIHLTEWNSSPSPRDFSHDYLQAATFIIKTNLESIGLVQSLSYWTFTDVFEEWGAGDTIFHGGFGMINYQGIVKPAFHAYRFLNALGDEVLARVKGGIVTREKSTHRIRAILYHYPKEVKQAPPISAETRHRADEILACGTPDSVLVKIKGMRPNASVVVETLDEAHGNAMHAWQEAGRPEAPTREQTEAIRREAMEVLRETHVSDSKGTFAWKRPIQPWSVVFIREL